MTEDQHCQQFHSAFAVVMQVNYTNSRRLITTRGVSLCWINNSTKHAAHVNAIGHCERRFLLAVVFSLSSFLLVSASSEKMTRTARRNLTRRGDRSHPTILYQHIPVARPPTSIRNYNRSKQTSE